MSEYKLRYENDKRLRELVLNLAAKCGWTVDLNDLSDGCPWLYINPSEGTAGTAHPNSILVAQGDVQGLADFISAIQKGAAPTPRKPVETWLKLIGGDEMRLLENGWMYFLPSHGTKYALCPEDAKRIVEAYNNTVK